MNRLVRLALASGLAVALTGCPHDHPHPHPHPHPTPADDEPTVVKTLFTDRYQLFVEYPTPVVGRAVEFLAHFTRLEDGAPVEDGPLDVVGFDAAGARVETKEFSPKRPGLYVPTLTFEAAGPVTVMFTLGAPHLESFDLGEVTVFADEAGAAAGTPDVAAGPDEVPFLLEQQWRIGLRLHEVAREDLTARLRVPGKVVARHGNDAHVTPPVAGAIVPPPGGLPELGERVAKGQLLGFIRPPLPATDLAALAANRAQLTALRQTLLLERTGLTVRRTELTAKKLELETTIEFAERTAARLADLAEKGLATDQENDDAARALATARTELTGTEGLLAQVARAVAQLDDLLPAEGVGDDARSTDLLLPLHAPIGGELVAAECIQGQSFAPPDSIFEIVESDVVWVEARVPEFDLPGLPAAPLARLHVPGDDATSIDLRAIDGARLVHVAPVVDSETHTARMLFEVPNGDRRLRVGQSLDVRLESRRRPDALAVPRDAVLYEDGRPIAYVVVGGETFQKRYLEVGVTDGDRVEVLAGLDEGERVAGRGAATIRLKSLTPSGVVDHHHH